jgi:hypothetical protein
MASPITDPALLAALEASDAPGKPVTDPKLLALLDGDHRPMAPEAMPAGFAIDGNGQPIPIDLASPDRLPNQTAGDKAMGALGVIDSGVRAVANGIPFMDRIAAAGGAATGIGGKFGDYSGNLAAQRAEDKKLEEAAPIANTAAHFVGGSLVPMGAAGAATRGATMLGKMLMGGSTGAGLGAAQGLSDTKDLTNFPDAAWNAGKGGVIGGTIGMGIPLAGKGIGAAYNKTADLVNGTASGISRGASRHLVDALMADGAPAVQQRMGQLGPDAMLADAGPAFLGKAQGASLNSDEGRLRRRQCRLPPRPR